MFFGPSSFDENCESKLSEQTRNEKENPRSSSPSAFFLLLRLRLRLRLPPQSFFIHGELVLHSNLCSFAFAFAFLLLFSMFSLS